MTTREMPFEVLSGQAIIIPIGGAHILYQGPTMPPEMAFANVQAVSATTTAIPQIDVFHFTEGTFLVWSSGPATDTLSIIETGKVYRVNVNVETIWGVPEIIGEPPTDMPPSPEPPVQDGVVVANIGVIVAVLAGIVLLSMGKKKR